MRAYVLRQLLEFNFETIIMEIGQSFSMVWDEFFTHADGEKN